MKYFGGPRTNHLHSVGDPDLLPLCIVCTADHTILFDLAVQQEATLTVHCTQADPIAKYYMIMFFYWNCLNEMCCGRNRGQSQV